MHDSEGRSALREHIFGGSELEALVPAVCVIRLFEAWHDGVWREAQDK